MYPPRWTNGKSANIVKKRMFPAKSSQGDSVSHPQMSNVECTPRWTSIHTGGPTEESPDNPSARGDVSIQWLISRTFFNGSRPQK